MVSRWSVRLILLAVLLLGVSSDRAADSCFSCESLCNTQYYSCRDSANTAYDNCTLLPWECFQAWSRALTACDNRLLSCRSACVPPSCDDGSGGGTGGGDPVEDPGGPVDFGPKPKPTGPQVPLTARDLGSPAAPQSVELRLSLEAYDAAGGLDIPLPKGVSRVTVEVRFTRPSDLLGSLVKFAGTTGASRDLRSFRNATRTALPPFQVGSYPVTGNVLRVEPVISGEAPGDEFEVRVTLFR